MDCRLALGGGGAEEKSSNLQNINSTVNTTMGCSTQALGVNKRFEGLSIADAKRLLGWNGRTANFGMWQKSVNDSGFFQFSRLTLMNIQNSILPRDILFFQTFPFYSSRIPVIYATAAFSSKSPF